MCDGCSILHFHFLRSQPIYKKAWPALRAASVFTVRIDFFFLFQKHLSEHNHILFCWCRALCAAGVHCRQHPSRFPSLQEPLRVAAQPCLGVRGCEPEGALPSSPLPAAEHQSPSCAVPQYRVWSGSAGRTLPKPAIIEATKNQQKLELGTKSQSNYFTV